MLFAYGGSGATILMLSLERYPASKGRLQNRIWKQMKKSIALYILIFVLGIAFLAVDASGSLRNCPDGIADYWKLDESSTGSYQDDISSNNGICDGECPSPVNGVVEYGQLFDGNNDGIAVDAQSTFDWSSSESFSIELWVQRDTGTISDLEAFVGRFDAAGLSWYIGINSFGQAQAQFKAADGSGPAQPLSGSKDLRSADTTWHHVVFVRNAQTNQNILFVDGEQEAAVSFDAYTADFNSATAPLTLGTWKSGSRLSGRLDEIAFYTMALDAKLIKSHYYIARDYCSIYDAPIKIMPLGDSITKGVWTSGAPPDSEMIGYRLDLAELFINNLYWSDFIGSEKNGGVNYDFDDDHAGFGGISDDQMFTLLSTGINESPSPDVQITNGPYLNFFPTEIILLHIGTNKMDTSSAAVSKILDEIDVFSKNVTVLVARIIDRAPNNPDVHTYNNNIETMVADRIAQGDKIISIDMESGAGIDYTIDTTSPYASGDMYDLLHPNPSGYNKMAVQWFTTLETLLPQSEVPLFTSTPSLNAVKGELFEYDGFAGGLPSPDYSLVNGPGSMTVDTQSGLVQWTPDATGDFSVSLRALNWAGEHQQHFTISVNALPVAVSDSYSGIREGGSMVVSAAQGVLQNDTDENDPLSAILVSNVSHGTLNLNSDGSFDYTHDGSEVFSDAFTYKASDGKAENDPVTTVTLNITSVNDAPVITGQERISARQGSTVTIDLSYLVVDDPDNQVPDDLSVIVESGPNYTVKNSNAVFVDENFVGELNVPTRVTDGSDISDSFDLVVTVSVSDNGSGGGGGSGCFISLLF
jgi:VCBS repeat-containing protein